MEIIKTQLNQTIYDLAAQYYGNAEAVGSILADNPAITNDPVKLVQMSIDYLRDKSFYMDVALKEGTEIKIDKSSRLYQAHVAKEIKQPVTTFDLKIHGTNN